MKLITEKPRRDIKRACCLTMDAALKMADADYPETDHISEMAASLALDVWPDVTARDLVTLGMGARYAYAVLTEGMGTEDGASSFADMVCSLRATVEGIEDKFGVSLG